MYKIKKVRKFFTDKNFKTVIINCARAIDYMAKSFQLPSYIRGYHVNKDLWNPSLRDLLHCQGERSNDKDRVCNSCCARWSHC